MTQTICHDCGNTRTFGSRCCHCINEITGEEMSEPEATPAVDARCPFCNQPLYAKGLYKCGTLVGATNPETLQCASGLIDQLSQQTELLRKVIKIIKDGDEDNDYDRCIELQTLLPRMEKALEVGR